MEGKGCILYIIGLVVTVLIWLFTMGIPLMKGDVNLEESYWPETEWNNQVVSSGRCLLCHEVYERQGDVYSIVFVESQRVLFFKLRYWINHRMPVKSTFKVWLGNKENAIRVLDYMKSYSVVGEWFDITNSGHTLAKIKDTRNGRVYVIKGEERHLFFFKKKHRITQSDVDKFVEALCIV